MTILAFLGARGATREWMPGALTVLRPHLGDTTIELLRRIEGPRELLIAAGSHLIPGVFVFDLAYA